MVDLMSPSELDQSDMMAAAEGDRLGLARLYDRHAPLLLALAERILKQRREAEDLVHDVFIEVWRCAGDYDPERGSVATWLRLRVRCRALDRLRSAGQTRALDTPSVEEGHAENAAELAVDRKALRAALAELPDEQRAVLMLGYFEGLSSTEIALVMGVPAGTVKSRVAAAMTKLRAHLGAPQGGAA
jgi:RNA polymerase sigma-70 factor (ECF subfamily)